MLNDRYSDLRKVRGRPPIVMGESFDNIIKAIDKEAAEKPKEFWEPTRKVDRPRDFIDDEYPKKVTLTAYNALRENVTITVLVEPLIPLFSL